MLVAPTLDNDFITTHKFPSLEQEDHALPEGPEVVDLVQRAAQLHVHEEAHAEDGEDKHHQEEKKADIEEGGDGHGQGKEKGADAARALDQPEHAPDLGHAHHPQQGGRDKVLLNQIAQ